MNLQESFAEIESVSFQANMNVLSGFNTLITVFEADEFVNGLIVAVKASPDLAFTVYNRFIEVLASHTQLEYSHPQDVALAAYLYALSQTSPAVARLAALPAQQMAQLWWTRRLAQHVQDPDPANA